MKFGIFDSGLGGLTVLKALSLRFPGADFAYLGDTAHLPYGTKSAEAVRSFLEANASFLIRQGPLDVLVIACATASSVYLQSDIAWHRKFIEGVSVPVAEVLAPAIFAARRLSAGRPIGIVGTPATINSGVAALLLRDYPSVLQACPLLVPLIEEGWLNHAVTRQILTEYLDPLKSRGICALILGCTHYSLLEKQFRAIMGEDIAYIDPGKALADALFVKFGKEQHARGHGVKRFFVTDKPYRFSELARMILGEEIIAEQVHID